MIPRHDTLWRRRGRQLTRSGDGHAYAQRQQSKTCTHRDCGPMEREGVTEEELKQVAFKGRTEMGNEQTSERAREKPSRRKESVAGYGERVTKETVDSISAKEGSKGTIPKEGYRGRKKDRREQNEEIQGVPQ